MLSIAHEFTCSPAGPDPDCRVERVHDAIDTVATGAAIKVTFEP